MDGQLPCARERDVWPAPAERALTLCPGSDRRQGMLAVNAGSRATCCPCRVAVGLQILFLMAVALAAATRRVHAFRSTLWSAGAVTTALGVREAQEMYTSMPLMDKADVRTWERVLLLRLLGGGCKGEKKLDAHVRRPCRAPAFHPAPAPAAGGARLFCGLHGGGLAVHFRQPAPGVLRRRHVSGRDSSERA